MVASRRSLASLDSAPSSNLRRRPTDASPPSQPPKQQHQQRGLAETPHQKAKNMKTETPRHSAAGASQHRETSTEPKKSKSKSKLLVGTVTTKEPSAKMAKFDETNSQQQGSTQDEDKIKTRRLHKTVLEKVPRCTICKQPKPDLYACSGCGLYYHLRKCYRLHEKTIAHINASKHWFCAKCVRCQACGEVIADPGNVECVHCGLVWHGKCKPNKARMFDGVYSCSKCTKKQNPEKQITKKKLETSEIKKDVYDFDMDEPPVFPPSFSLNRFKAASPHQLQFSDKLLIKQEDEPSTSDSAKKKSNVSRKRKLADKQQSEANFEERKMILEARSEIYDELLEAHNKRMTIEGQRKSLSRSPSKSPDKKQRRFTLQEDRDLFTAALKEYQSTKREISRPSVPSTIDKWVYLGGGQKMKAIYDSPYPEEIRRAPAIYVCMYCLTAQEDKERYRIHQMNCEFRYPPGNEIYRDNEISFFEVDGSKQQWYCRNLCLLAKMFISSKTLHHEVDTFLFYILTELKDEGCQLVGYFSKEKNPSKNNNLSCLLTLPISQRSGYGRLLIDMSYELSRVERKVGSPEHPLSDLGLLTYRGYWRSSILCYLRSIRATPHTSIKDMSLATRIHPTDIVNQLMHDRLLIYKHGVYYVKAAKRAYKWPLSTCRRRTVDAEKLLWKPSFDETQLDAQKLNYYV